MMQDDAANETALVAHTCVFSALQSCKQKISANPGGFDWDAAGYLQSLEKLLDSWPLRKMALAYHTKLAKAEVRTSFFLLRQRAARTAISCESPPE